MISFLIILYVKIFIIIIIFDFQKLKNKINGASYSMNPPIEKLLPFYTKLKNHNNDRYRSFNHCYSYFKSLKIEQYDESLELAMLHLGFYLASWGMYRGSSFLIQKDFKIYKPIIETIFNDEYIELRNLDNNLNINNYKELAELTFKLHKDLQIKLNIERKNYFNYINKPNPKNNISSTLTTKIMLGILGCTPAYDRYFKSGIKEYNKVNNSKLIQNFSMNSIAKTYQFAIDNKLELLNIQSEIFEETNYKYPIMKLIDSYFWSISVDKKD